MDHRASSSRFFSAAVREFLAPIGFVLLLGASLAVLFMPLPLSLPQLIQGEAQIECASPAYRYHHARINKQYACR